MQYTKGEWKFDEELRANLSMISGDNTVVCGLPNPIPTGDEKWDEEELQEMRANARLIATAPKGYELAEAVIELSATWIDEGLLEVGEADYSLLKKLALELRDKALAKEDGK